jgi:hypothetical protein
MPARAGVTEEGKVLGVLAVQSCSVGGGQGALTFIVIKASQRRVERFGTVAILYP